jgi:hypothetical protein
MEDPEGSNLFEPCHVCEIVGRRIKIEGPASKSERGILVPTYPSVRYAPSPVNLSYPRHENAVMPCRWGLLW